MTYHQLPRLLGSSIQPLADSSSPPRPPHARQRAGPLIRIAFFGGMALHSDGREMDLSSRKAMALIAYLVLTPGMKATRVQLVGLLWSDTEEAKARASLRQLIHLVRYAFEKEGLEGLTTDRDSVKLDGSIFVTDLDCALESIERGVPLDLLIDEPRITDSFLRFHDDLDPSFDSWLATKRESVRQRLIRALEAQLSDTSHSTEATKRIARTLLQIDPTQEVACQHLMRACVASGNVGGALAAYKQLWECLEEDYDIEPSAMTQELVVAIKNAS
jgi:DNA-binding SARP family transcriptional activator